VGGGVRAGHQQAVAPLDDRTRDAGDLLRRLALAEDHFWKALTDCTMVIDPSETEVFEGIALQLEGASLRLCRIEPALANGFEQTTKG
jgi:hypothetical protein